MQLKIATWNINSVRLRIDLVCHFLKTWRPDVLCLQETKCPQGQFPSAQLSELGYGNLAEEAKPSGSILISDRWETGLGDFGLMALELLFVVGFWVNIYIGFYREAIVIHDQGPLRAIYTSFNVVRRNFWGTLGFLALSLIISLGSGVIWFRLVGSTVGLIVAMIGSAYIGSGLLAARMAFFRERLRRWQSAPVQPTGLRARN